MAKAQYTHDAVATTGEYTNRDGEKKKEYTNVGKAFTDDQGRVSIKLKCIPVGPEWSGWVSLYPKKEHDPGAYHSAPQARQAPAAPQARTPYEQAAHSKTTAAPAYSDEDDDIPF
jgi:hypothetical protein